MAAKTWSELCSHDNKRYSIGKYGVERVIQVVGERHAQEVMQIAEELGMAAPSFGLGGSLGGSSTSQQRLAAQQQQNNVQHPGLPSATPQTDESPTWTNPILNHTFTNPGRWTWGEGDEGETTIRPREIYAQNIGTSDTVSPKASQSVVDALERSKHLLIDSLSPDQIKDFAKNAHIKVVGSRTGHIYTIFPAHVYNIRRDDGKRFCATLSPWVCPLYDAMLAQKIAIELDEEAFLDVANVHQDGSW